MTSCDCHVEGTTEGDKRTLQIALGLNAGMFLVGIIAGLIGQSTGLLADALDMLSDASAYAIALLAIGHGARFKANAAILSGGLLLVLGIGVLVEVMRRAAIGSEPVSALMLVIATLSIVVNATVLQMLRKFRHCDVHLRASWIFTRADIVANLGVIISGALVALLHTRWPDLVIGSAIGLYVTKEALEILREGKEAKRASGVAKTQVPNR